MSKKWSKLSFLSFWTSNWRFGVKKWLSGSLLTPKTQSDVKIVKIVTFCPKFWQSAHFLREFKQLIDWPEKGSKNRPPGPPPDPPNPWGKSLFGPNWDLCRLRNWLFRLSHFPIDARIAIRGSFWSRNGQKVTISVKNDVFHHFWRFWGRKLSFGAKIDFGGGNLNYIELHTGDVRF